MPDLEMTTLDNVDHDAPTEEIPVVRPVWGVGIEAVNAMERHERLMDLFHATLGGLALVVLLTAGHLLSRPGKDVGPSAQGARVTRMAPTYPATRDSVAPKPSPTDSTLSRPTPTPPQPSQVLEAPTATAPPQPPAPATGVIVATIGPNGAKEFYDLDLTQPTGGVLGLGQPVVVICATKNSAGQEVDELSGGVDVNASDVTLPPGAVPAGCATASAAAA